ncbi:MAG: GldG family protein [Verrucomicrobiota bacterium JB022]|nr:GldG family protein [Verrucomicrobiota bacterium JB022]
MPALDQFRMTNLGRRANRLLQTALILCLLGGINYLAMNHYHRQDLSQRHLYALSPETRAYLRELENPVRVIVTFTGNPETGSDRLKTYLEGLLREYQEAARMGPNDIEVEFVNIFQDLARAEQLQQRYGLQQPEAILVVSDQRQRILLPPDLAEFDGEDTPTAFKGEQALTSAILEVTAPRQPTIYFTSGHDEMRLDDVSPSRGLSVVAGALRERNFAVGTLDLTQVENVPETTDLVVIAGPRGPFTRAEQEKLRRYLNDEAGRVMLLLGPGRDYGLDELIASWGIRMDDMMVLEDSSDFLVDSGSYLIRQFAEHPITQFHINNEVYVVGGLSRPARASGQPMGDERLTVTNIMGSSATSWGERAYRTGPARYDAGVDLAGPVPLAVAAERRTSSQLQINIPGGRVVAFGCGELFANQRMSAPGNQALLLQSINWLLNRDQFLAIPPRPVDSYRLTASRGELQELSLYFLLVPGAVGLAGFILYWLRRI